MPRGDDEWTLWLEQMVPAAVLYARQICAAHADAEDAVHDGFARFWVRRDSARDARALFFACVRSAALDQRRARQRRGRREMARAREIPLFALVPERAAWQEEVQRALAQLGEAQRETVVLKIWAGLTFAQMGVALGEPASTLAARYRAGISGLSKLLSPEIERGR